MKTLLLTGASGFLGFNFLQLDLSNWRVVVLMNNRPFHHSTAKSIQCDLADLQTLKDTFRKIKPDAVIHLAALSNTNFCEEHPELSNSVNVDASVLLAEECFRVQIPYLFTSTDLVFDGHSGNYKETDTVNPLMLYGKQKATAEKLISEVYSDACILRLPLMFGYGGDYAESFLKSYLQGLNQHQKMKLFTDEYRSIADGKSAAQGILMALEDNWRGIYHLGGKEKLSRYDFGLLVCECFGLDSRLIIPTLQSEIKMKAKRPADVSLNSEKAYKSGYNPIDLNTALTNLRKHF